MAEEVEKEISEESGTGQTSPTLPRVNTVQGGLGSRIQPPEPPESPELIGLQITIAKARRAVGFLAAATVLAGLLLYFKRWEHVSDYPLYAIAVGVLAGVLFVFGFVSLFEMYLAGRFVRFMPPPMHSELDWPGLYDTPVAIGVEKGMDARAAGLGVGDDDSPVLDVDLMSAVEEASNSISDRLVNRSVAGEDPFSRDPRVRHYSGVQEHIRLARRRIQGEIDTIQRRRNLNLVFGAATTFAAVAILVWVASAPVAPLDEKVSPYIYWMNVLQVLAPRIFIALFVEIFSFFFLRLYRSSVQESKYFQNELTNLDVRAIAVEVALLSDDKEAMKALAAELSRTERNFVLEKGETTVDLEVAKAEVRGLREFMSSVSGLLRPENKKTP